MSLVNYITGLFPTFKKDKVIDSCTMTKQSLVEHTLSLYDSAAVAFKPRGFKSKELKDYVLIYNKTVQRTADGGELIENIRDILKNSVILLDHIAEASKKEFSTEEASIALTYKKATYLRAVQAIEFCSLYARKFLNYVYIIETQNADKLMSIRQAMLPIEIKWVEDNYLSFCDAMLVAKTSKDRFIKAVEGLPEATITELTESTFPSTIGATKIDPLQLQNLSVSWNPIYLIGMQIANYQVGKYKSAQAEMELIQMRKLNLEKIYENAPDAKLQKEIDYMQDRVDTLHYKLSQMEQKYDN